MISESERPYDIGNKGYLTKFERQLKELDDEILDSGHPIPDHRQQRRASTSTMASSSFTRSIPSPHRLPNKCHTSAPYNKDGGDDDDDDEEEEEEYEEYDDDNEDMDLSYSGLDLSGTGTDDSVSPNKANYQHYLSKVQRDFREADLRGFGEQESPDGKSYWATGIFRTGLMYKSNSFEQRGHHSYRPRSCCGFSRGRAVLLASIAAVLLVANLIMSWTVWKELSYHHQEQQFTVDAVSGALMTEKNGSLVPISTIGAGFSVELPVIMPESGLGDFEQDYPFACIGVANAVRLWTSVMEGVSTSVVLVNKDTANDDFHRAEYGVRLTFQGASQNSTHACLPTLNKHQTLCVDFVSRRCEAIDGVGEGEGEEEDDDDDEYNGGDEQEDDIKAEDQDDPPKDLDHEERRALFQKLVKDKELGRSSQYNNHGALRRRVEECQYGRWCHNFASIVLIGG